MPTPSEYAHLLSERDQLQRTVNAARDALLNLRAEAQDWDEDIDGDADDYGRVFATCHYNIRIREDALRELVEVLGIGVVCGETAGQAIDRMLAAEQKQERRADMLTDKKFAEILDQAAALIDRLIQETDQASESQAAALAILEGPEPGETVRNAISMALAELYES